MSVFKSKKNFICAFELTNIMCSYISEVSDGILAQIVGHGQPYGLLSALVPVVENNPGYGSPLPHSRSISE